MSFTSVVLAGGRGRRLGRDKVWETLNGENLLERVVQRLSRLRGEILIVLDRPKPLPRLSQPVSTTVDLFPGRGSLGGLYTGVRQSPGFYSVVVACDMPFLNPALLGHLLGLAPGYDVVVPRLEGLAEPLHAVYAKTCLPAMEALLQRKGRRIIEFFPQLRVRYVEEAEIDPIDPQHRSFFNINTPADRQHALSLLRQEKP